MKKLVEFLVFSSLMCFLQPVTPFPQPDSKTLRRISCSDPKEYPNNNVCCLSCEAGEYVKTHCTEAGKKGVCEECDIGTFMKYANGLEQCFKCTQCHSDQDVVSLCTHTQDTLCQCKAGRFCHPDQACEVCKKCSRCQSDEEAVRNCTSTTDTECRKTLPKSTADSDAALIAGILVCVLILVFVGGVLIFICKRTRPTDSQRSPSDSLKAGLDYSEVSRAGPQQLRGLKPSPSSEEDMKMLCDSLHSSASNSQHSLTALQSSACPPLAREDEPFPTLVPVNGVDSLRRCFEFFGELDMDFHKRFFRSLSLNDNEIKSKESLPYEDKVHELLNIWVEHKGRDASLNELLQVLLDLNQRRTAEMVKEKAVQNGYYCCQ